MIALATGGHLCDLRLIQTVDVKSVLFVCLVLASWDTLLLYGKHHHLANTETNEEVQLSKILNTEIANPPGVGAGREDATTTDPPTSQRASSPPSTATSGPSTTTTTTVVTADTNKAIAGMNSEQNSHCREGKRCRPGPQLPCIRTGDRSRATFQPR